MFRITWFECKENRNVRAKKNQGLGQQFADGTIRAFTFSNVIDDDLQSSISTKSND